MTITAAGLTIARGGEIVAEPDDFTLSGGDALLVIGPNGAGKSTLLRTLAGLLPLAAGRLTVEGALAPDGEPAATPGEIAHYLGHRNGMKPAVTVADNLLFWQRFLGGGPGGPGGSDVAAALDAVGLGDLGHLPFGYLSAGQQRRAAMARLLVAHRALWILDEPTAALDTASQATFARLLTAHLSAGGLVVAATHQPLGIEGRTLRIERFDPAVAAADDADPAAEGFAGAPRSGRPERDLVRSATAESWW
ncbi:heme ABC exporter ATP-binding protein CcmA [Aurantimonas sp. CSK15Z-1]|nr:heme ABC exporter ATP-binding protein CcmA [Aurantimonas sp. CSK15Z-1]